MSQETLHREILAKSEAEEWNAAREEWCLKHIWISDDPETCLCGHSPIREICVIHNNENGKEADVGNCCVNKFVGLNTEVMFSSVRRVVDDVEASFNPKTIKFAHDQRIIDDRERSFYLDIWRKQDLSDKQLKWKRAINKAILRAITR